MRHRLRSLIALALFGQALLGSPAVAQALPDVPTYRGDAGRTGVMPGPGPTGQPTVLWRYEAGRPIASQVAVADDTIYLLTVVGTVHALDPVTRSARWTADVDAPSRASPSVADGLVIVPSEAGIHAFRVDDGTVAWQNLDIGQVAGTPAIVDGLVIAASDGGTVSALRVEDGAVTWVHEAGGSVGTSVAAGDDLVVVGTVDGEAVALDQRTGRERWRQLLDAGARVATPTVADGLVFVATLEGGGPGSRHVRALDPETGALVWAVDNPGDLALFPPAVLNDRAFIGGLDGSVSAVGGASGGSIWRYEAPGPVDIVAAVVDDTVFSASNGGWAFALDAATGEERWRVPIEGIPYGFAVTGGLVLVGTTSGTLFVIGEGSS